MTGRKIGWIIGGVVTVAAIGAALSAESGSVQAYGEIAVAGQALPQHDSGVADPAVGVPAPAITGEAMSVEPGTSPTIVLFLAHWCPACQAEVPALTDWVEAHGLPVGVDLIAVATASSPSRGNYPPSIWLERERFPFPVIYDDEAGTAAAAYGLSAFPFWVVLDSDGLVVERFSGQLPDDEAISNLFAAVAGL
ncbi:MAG: TlpA disulfide reductase family protein [Acidimicrobiia bacterium]